VSVFFASRRIRSRRWKQGISDLLTSSRGPTMLIVKLAQGPCSLAAGAGGETKEV